MNFTLIGKKVGMTQIFDENNSLVPVTVIEAGPCAITQVKTTQSDNYNAVQIGFGPKKRYRSSKAMLGHFKKSGTAPFARLTEVRCQGEPEWKAGQVLTVAGFKGVPKVDVMAITKGQGFQGVVKRWGFSGGPASHGSMMHRRGGSYGQCQWPGKVYKGRKMPGHMGAVRRTVQNLKIVKVLEDKNLLLLKGSVPGANGAYILVRAAKKIRKTA